MLTTYLLMIFKTLCCQYFAYVIFYTQHCHLQACRSSALCTVGVIPRKCSGSTALILKVLGDGTARDCRQLLLSWVLSFDCPYSLDMEALEFRLIIVGGRFSPLFDIFNRGTSAAKDSRSTAVERSEIMVVTSCWYFSELNWSNVSNETWGSCNCCSLWITTNCSTFCSPVCEEEFCLPSLTLLPLEVKSVFREVPYSRACRVFEDVCHPGISASSLDGLEISLLFTLNWNRLIQHPMLTGGYDICRVEGDISSHSVHKAAFGHTGFCLALQA
jgi:hypothetical protein